MDAEMVQMMLMSDIEKIFEKYADQGYKLKASDVTISIENDDVTKESDCTITFKSVFKKK